jgi:hypothetical protein
MLVLGRKQLFITFIEEGEFVYCVTVHLHCTVNTVHTYSTNRYIYKYLYSPDSSPEIH